MKKIFFLLIVFILAISSIVYIQIDEKTKSGLQITTNDKPSSIYLDQTFIDKTPFIDKNLKPGTYNLEIIPDDSSLVPYETKITLNKGLLTVVEWNPDDSPKTSQGLILQMEKLSNFKNSEVSFITIPNSTIVHLDNREQQFTPLIVSDLEPGDYSFTISLPAYKQIKQTIKIEPGYRINVFAKLGREKDSLSENQEKNLENEANKANETTPTATINPSITTTITPTQTEEITPTILPTINETTKKVTIKVTNFFLNNKEGVRVREKPAASSKEVGFALSNQSYPYLEEEQAGWYKIEIDEKIGWVSGKYVDIK